MRQIGLLICLLLLSCPGWGQPAAPATPAERTGTASAAAPDVNTGAPATSIGTASQQPANVRVGQSVIFTLRASRAGRTPAERADDTNRVLQEVLSHPEPARMRAEVSGDVAVVYADRRPLVQLTGTDARLEGDATLEAYANGIATRVSDALKNERQRTALAGKIFDVSLAVLFSLLALILLRRTWRLGRQASEWLNTHPNQVPPLKLRSAELLNRSTVHTLFVIGATVARWVVLVAIFYAWLIAVFSLFGSTRGLTDQLTGALLSPVATLSSRVAAALPPLVIVLLALLPLLVLLRAVRLYFSDVADGTIKSTWLHKDLATPAGTLVEIGIILAALILVAPVITGNPQGAAPQLGLVLLAAFALAAVPLLASVVVGAATLFARQLAVGDWVDFGGQFGRIVKIGLLEATVRDNEGIETHIPHLARLLHAVSVHGRHGQKRRVSVPFMLQRELLSPAFAERLEQALYAAGSNPHVRLLELGITHATVELSVTSSSRDTRSALLWIALTEVQAVQEASQKANQQVDQQTDHQADPPADH